MKRIPIFLLLGLLCGCGGAYGKHAAFEKEVIQALNDLADVLESVKDKDSSKAAADKIENVSDRMEKLKKRGDALPKLTKEEEEKLNQTFKDDREKAAKRLRSASTQAGIQSTEPSFINAMQRSANARRELEKK